VFRTCGTAVELPVLDDKDDEIGKVFAPIELMRRLQIASVCARRATGSSGVVIGTYGGF